MYVFIYSNVDLSSTIPSTLPEGVDMCIDLSSPINTDGIIQIGCVLTFSSTVPVSITDCVTLTENNTNIM